jgi:hypothetical protein
MKKVQTLRINRETLIRLDSAALQQLVGGHKYTVLYNSCGVVCP